MVYAAGRESLEVNQQLRKQEGGHDRSEGRFDAIAHEVQTSFGKDARNGAQLSHNMSKNVNWEKLGFHGCGNCEIVGAGHDSKNHGTLILAGKDGVRHTFDGTGREIDTSKAEKGEHGREYQYDKDGGHHTLKPGERLDDISRDMLKKHYQNHGGTDNNYKPSEHDVARQTAEIARENNIKDPNKVWAGQQLHFKGEHPTTDQKVDIPGRDYKPETTEGMKKRLNLNPNENQSPEHAEPPKAGDIPPTADGKSLVDHLDDTRAMLDKYGTKQMFYKSLTEDEVKKAIAHPKSPDDVKKLEWMRDHYNDIKNTDARGVWHNEIDYQGLDHKRAEAISHDPKYNGKLGKNDFDTLSHDSPRHDTFMNKSEVESIARGDGLHGHENSTADIAAAQRILHSGAFVSRGRVGLLVNSESVAGWLVAHEGDH